MSDDCASSIRFKGSSKAGKKPGKNSPLASKVAQNLDSYLFESLQCSSSSHHFYLQSFFRGFKENPATNLSSGVRSMEKEKEG